MPRYIDAIKLLKEFQALPCCRNGYSDEYDKACIFAMIDNQPRVDAVEVVRCKDCKWGDYHGTTDEGKPYYYCVITEWAGQPPEFFCANGKKKGDRR